jgi:hypothetical protein
MSSAILTALEATAVVYVILLLSLISPALSLLLLLGGFGYLYARCKQLKWQLQFMSSLMNQYKKKEPRNTSYQPLGA